MKIGRNDPCWCGSGRKYKRCHMERDLEAGRTGESTVRDGAAVGAVVKGRVRPMRPVPPHIERPEYVETGSDERDTSARRKLGAADIDGVRAACRAARRVLNRAVAAVRAGVTTDAIDAIVHDACIAEGGYPSPLNYHGFPKSVCTSVNEVICHGIPDDRPLADGDIVNVDVTIYLGGYHGDCSETVAVGEIDDESRRLISVARDCLAAGIAAVRPDGMLREVGRAVEQVAERGGCSVVRAYCGHGIGRLFHTAPTVSHVYDPRDRTRIRPGMIFTVEPMINLGAWDHRTWEDGWTAVTVDGRRSAQFEHTILVTDRGPEILTGVAGAGATEG